MYPEELDEFLHGDIISVKEQILDGEVDEKSSNLLLLSKLNRGKLRKLCVAKGFNNLQGLDKNGLLKLLVDKAD